MDSNSHERTQSYIVARQQNPAWQLLAGRRAPLVLGCLQALFEESQDGVGYDDAQQALAELLAGHAGLSEFEISGDPAMLARRELRTWIRRSLVVEREGRLNIPPLPIPPTRERKHRIRAMWPPRYAARSWS